MQSQGDVDRLRINGPSVARHATSNHEDAMYPSHPGVEGAPGTSAGGPKGRLAAPRKNVVILSLLAST
jgi:hypothetical protein